MISSISTNVTNTVPTNITNTAQTNVTSSVSMNSGNKKVRYKMHFCILHTFFRDHIIIYNHYYLLSLCKTWVNAKRYLYTKNIKMEKQNEFLKIGIKSRTSYSFDDIIKIEDFHFDNISLNKKSYENILIYDVL